MWEELPLQEPREEMVSSGGQFVVSVNVVLVSIAKERWESHNVKRSNFCSLSICDSDCYVTSPMSISFSFAPFFVSPSHPPPKHCPVTFTLALTTHVLLYITKQSTPLSVPSVCPRLAEFDNGHHTHSPMRTHERERALAHPRQQLLTLLCREGIIEHDRRAAGAGVQEVEERFGDRAEAREPAVLLVVG